MTPETKTNLRSIKLDRQMAVRAMHNMGWTAERAKRGKTPVWIFTRPDTGGLWDRITIRQDQLSMTFVANQSMAHGDAPELASAIKKLKDDWISQRFFGLSLEFNAKEKEQS